MLSLKSRHGRACPGHPRLSRCQSSKTWTPGTSPGMTPSFLNSQRALDGLHAIAFDDVAGAHVAVVLERHAAFLAGGDLLHLVLEAFQRRQLAFVHDDVVAD